jgi:hypothetical protein
VSGQPPESDARTELVRFVVPSRIHPESQTAIGVVAMAYELCDSTEVNPELQAELSRLLTWIEDNIDAPERFNRTKSKGWYRRETRGISWLRASAGEHVDAFRSLANVVARCGYDVSEIRETRVGYLTYEDDVQVVAEPFRDTRRR